MVSTESSPRSFQRRVPFPEHQQTPLHLEENFCVFQQLWWSALVLQCIVAQSQELVGGTLRGHGKGHTAAVGCGAWHVLRGTCRSWCDSILRLPGEKSWEWKSVPCRQSYLNLRRESVEKCEIIFVNICLIGNIDTLDNWCISVFYHNKHLHCV